MNSEMDRLLGTWKSDYDLSSGLGTSSETTLKFGADGSLTYRIHESDRDQVMLLTFRVEEPGFIVTDQPSSPRQEKTAYEITSDGKLILAFGNEKSRYVRASE